MNRASIHTETGDSHEMINDVMNSNAKNISEDLHNTQVSSRSNNRAVISLIESSHHGKASEVYEVDSGIISNINIFAFESLLEEDNLDEWLLKAESNLLVEAERLSIVEESDNISLINHVAKDNHYVTKRNTVIYKEEGSNDNNNAFDFETVSENDNLDDWFFRAENSSIAEKFDEISTKACDTEKIKLAVKRNKFVSVNGVEIKKDIDISSNIRALLNHLVNKEQITKSNEDKSDIKGMIRADCI